MGKKRSFAVRLLSLLSAAAVLLASVPAASAAGRRKLVLATASDLHYCPDVLMGNRCDEFCNYAKASNCVYDDIDAIVDAWLNSVRRQVLSEGLKYVVLVGDLALNGEYEAHKALAEKLDALERETGVKVYVVNGNHDINKANGTTFENDKREGAKKTAPQDFVDLYWNFGYGEAYHRFRDFRCGRGGALSYSVRLDEGYRLIFADGGKYTADTTDKRLDTAETGGRFFPELLSWIKDEAAEALDCGETPLLFTHWNMSGMGYMHEKLVKGFVIDDGYILQEELADAGIHYTFSGHMHVSDVDITYSDSGEPMYSIITPTLTEFPFAYRVTEFDPNPSGGLDVRFDQKRCDEYAPVRLPSGEGSYPAPYAYTGYRKQFGDNADIAKYGMNMIRNALAPYVDGIREAGSIVGFIEKKLDIDLEQKLDELLLGKLSLSGKNIPLARCLMSFIKDLDAQLTEKYINKPDVLFGLVEDTLRQLVGLKISDVPCTKFIGTYGFGSPDRPGTLADAILSVLIYYYSGSADISDDPFMLSVLDRFRDPEIADFVVDSVKRYVAEELLVDKLLDNVYIHLNTLFYKDPSSPTPQRLQILFEILVALLGSGCFRAKSIRDMAAGLQPFLSDFNDGVSVKDLAEAVLGTGLIKYGGTTDEILDFVIEKFVTPDMKAALSFCGLNIVESMVTDTDRDFGVTYSCNGPIEVTPTREDMQLPVNVTLAPGEDASTSFTATWFTKYSVTGSDIEIMKKDSGSFTGKASMGKNILSSSETENFSSYGLDIGTFGFLTWNKSVVRHSVTVGGLEPATEYVFRIGDAEKGFWERGSIKTAPRAGGKFTFLHLSDSEGVVPAQFEGLGRVLRAAEEELPDAAFAIHTGSLAKKPVNDCQWSFALNSGYPRLNSLPLIYAAGEADRENTGSVKKYFTVNGAPEQADGNGIYHSFDYGGAHFAVLNTNNADEKDGRLSPAQLKWLGEDLAGSKADWKIIAMHGSIYGASENSALREQIIKLAGEYGVDLILQGSESAYVRTKRLHDGKLPEKPSPTRIISVDGTRYVASLDPVGTVTAAGGYTGHSFADFAPESPLYGFSRACARPMFSGITVDGDTLLFSAYTVNEDGKAERIDKLAIKKETVSVLLGDLDSDGVLTAGDARAALRYAVGLSERLTAEQKIAADVDGNGAVTAADARGILRAAVELEGIVPERRTVPVSELAAIDF